MVVDVQQSGSPKGLYINGSLMNHMVQNWYNMEMEIILLLIKGKSHVRGIAQELKASHSTVLRKLNKLVAEGVLDCKTEGKNKVFYIKKSLQAKTCVFGAEWHKLAKLLQTYPELGIIIEDVLKNTGRQMVVLFGSYAKFTAKKDSDIDIYVETMDRKFKEKLEMINSKLSIKIGSFDLDANLVREIIKNHVILKGMEEFYDKTKFFK